MWWSGPPDCGKSASVVQEEDQTSRFLAWAEMWDLVTLMSDVIVLGWKLHANKHNMKPEAGFHTKMKIISSDSQHFLIFVFQYISIYSCKALWDAFLKRRYKKSLFFVQLIGACYSKENYSHDEQNKCFYWLMQQQQQQKSLRISRRVNMTLKC